MIEFKLSNLNLSFSFKSSSKIPLISVKAISKRFPGTVALDNVDFDVYEGEVHALLGENGAGKSTLVKILYGLYSPDSGKIYVRGKEVSINSPRDAVRYGIVMVSQVPQLIDRLTVAENIILGLEKYGLISRIEEVREYIRAKSKELGVEVDPDAEVWKLSYTQKQLVELLRALLIGAKVLLLDEAITFLPLIEKRRFYRFIKEFANDGGAVVLITHKIYEAMDVADRITVLRQGRIVGTVRRDEVTPEIIRKMMFAERSRQVIYDRLPISKPRDTIALDVRNLWVMGDYGVYAVKGVNLTVRAGEVVGIAGIAGNGQQELVQAIIGLRKVDKGNIVLYSEDITNKGVARIRAKGVGYIPDQPTKYGISLDNSIEENLAMLPVIAKSVIRWGNIRELASKLIIEFNILTPSPRTPVKMLSGGNIMKVIVSRELLVAKKLLVAYNPTRALDEVTAIMVRRMIKEKAVSNGIGVLLVSEDLDEIFQVADTIAVMNSGRIVGVFPANKVDRDEIEKLMVM